MANWSAEIVQTMWAKGSVVPDNDPAMWRKDQCGAWIGQEYYGERDSQYGREIDHVFPGGPDALSNLRPLQWQNNVAKRGGRLKCNVTASGKDNVEVE